MHRAPRSPLPSLDTTCKQTFKISLSTQNLFADFAKCNEHADQADSAVAMSSRLVTMCYTFYSQDQDTCTVRLLFLVTVQYSAQFQIYGVTRSYSRGPFCALLLHMMDSFCTSNCMQSTLNNPNLVDTRRPFQQDYWPSLLELTT